MVNGGEENVLDLRETPLVVAEIDGIAALEIHLNENEALVVLALNRLEETTAPKHLLQHQIVRRRQVVKVVLRRRNLRRARDLVPHSAHPPRFSIGNSFFDFRHFLLF